MASVQEVQQKIFEEINNRENRIFLKVQKKQINRKEYLENITRQCRKEDLDENETKDIVELVDKSLWGFGIIDELINDPDISDIRLINENNIRIKRLGKRMATDIKFVSREEYERYIEFITNRNSTTMSVSNATQIFTDKDSNDLYILRFTLTSALVNTSDRPTLLIRKISKVKKTLDYLVGEGFCTSKQADYLSKRWESGHGMLICGPNGSGKTTLANALIDKTPEDKSAIVMQESEELFSDHPEMIFRKVIPPRNGTSISYDLRNHARIALKESFDVIVIGEITGDEAADLSYATYTGSQAMTTVHSNSAKKGYEKLVDYALDAQPNRTKEHFAKQIESLDTVVYVADYKVQEICTLKCYNKHTDEFEFDEIHLEGE